MEKSFDMISYFVIKNYSEEKLFKKYSKMICSKIAKNHNYFHLSEKFYLFLIHAL